MRSIHVLIGNSMSAGLQFINIVWIAREYGPELMGGVALILGFFAPVQSFLTASQRYEILAHKGQEPFVSHLFLRVAVLFIAGCMYLLLFGRASEEEMLVLAVCVFVYRLVDACLELVGWKRQVAEDTRGYIFVAVMRASPVALVMLGSVIFEIELVWYFGAIAACGLLLLFLGAGPSATAKLFIDFRRVSLKRVGLSLGVLIPIGGAALLESSIVVAPRFLLAQLEGGLEVVAAYVFFTQLLIIYGFVASAKLQRDLPFLASYAEENRRLDNGFLCSSVMKTALIIGGMSTALLAPELVWGWLFGLWVIEYLPYVWCVPLIAIVWYCGGYLVNALVLVHGKVVVVVATLASCLSMAAGLWTVEVAGINALAGCMAALAFAFVVRVGFAIGFVWLREVFR